MASTTKNFDTAEDDLALRLRRQGSSGSERDSFYMDFGKGIDSDIELEPVSSSQEPADKKDESSQSASKLNSLPKLRDLSKQEGEEEPKKVNGDIPLAEPEMPNKTKDGGGSSKDSKPAAKPASPKPPGEATTSQASRKPQRGADNLKEAKSRQGGPDKAQQKRPDQDQSKSSQVRPRSSSSTSNIASETHVPATPNQNRARKPTTPNLSGNEERSRTPRPRPSASSTSLDQINKQPVNQRDPRPVQRAPPNRNSQSKSPQTRRASPAAPHDPVTSPNRPIQFNRRPARGPTTPISPNDESINPFDDRRNEQQQKQPSVNYHQEPMSEMPRRARRPPPKSPVTSRQNNVQRTPPQSVPANGRLRNKHQDSNMENDPGLWMTQNSNGQSETILRSPDDGAGEFLVPKAPIRNDLCGSCASLASKRGGSTSDLKPLAWKDGVDGIITILSGMYGKVLVVMGISFPLAEVIAHKLPLSFYEGFYLYLYGLSIAFVCYTYLFVIGPDEGLLCCKQESNLQKFRPMNYSQTGSFYLRIGAVLFGIASMIYSGLEFGQYFELASDSHCYNVMQAMTPCFRMAFTFIQLYFIFLNSKLCIRKSRSLCKFGLMHLMATNICIWLHVLIQESVHQIVLNWNEHNVLNSTVSTYDNLTESASPPTSHAHFLTHRCRYNSVIGRLVHLASPFLFPCTIEYSLICASILFRMWKNVQLKSYKVQSSGSLSSLGGSRPNRDYYRVDCSNANKGLFLGIFFLVMSLIGLVLFYVLIDEPEFEHLAIFELHVCELTVHFFAMIAVLIASIQVRKLKYDPFRNTDLDTMLLVISQSGVYLHCVFVLISSHFSLKSDINSVLAVLTNFIILIQATIQTVFILDATRRNCVAPDEIRRKPARELVTFLLVCNLSMWAMNILENHKADSNPVHLEFYGFWAWTIISHITTPLTIFYRFHSTVCLCEIWKKMYKPSKLASVNSVK